MLDKTSRFVLVAVLSLFALACGNKEEPKQAPDKSPPPAEAPAVVKAQAGAAQPVTGLQANPGEATPDTAEASGLVPELQKLADKACACKDEKCASGIQDELAKLMAEAKKPADSEAQAIGTTMQKLQGCIVAAQKK